MESHAVLIAEIADLRRWIDEFKSHKCFGFCGACRENLEQMELYRTRLSEAEAENAGLRKHLESAAIGLGKSRVDRIEQLEAALKEAHERNMGNLGGSCARAEAQDAALAESERKREEAERTYKIAKDGLFYAAQMLSAICEADGSTDRNKARDNAYQALREASVSSIPTQEKQSDKEKI